jgi:transcription initiation factor TFIIB
LNLPKQVQKLAELIVGKASNIESINGKSPVSLAAAAIYIASEVTSNSRSLEDISKICGAAVTTTNTYDWLVCTMAQTNSTTNAVNVPCIMNGGVQSRNAN